MPNDTNTISQADALDRLTFYAGQQRIHSGRAQKCPRCGRPDIKPKLHTNALSRIRRPDIYVCDACGNEEALEAIPGNDKKPVTEWAAMKTAGWRCTL